LPHAVAQPFTQVLAPNPQRRHPDQGADPIKRRQGLLGGEEQASLEVLAGRQFEQLVLQRRWNLVELVDQQRSPSQQLQQQRTVVVAAEQLAAIGPQQRPVKAQHQLLAISRTEMDQGGQVVLLQTGLTADQHGAALGVSRGLAHGLPQVLRIPTAAHHTAPGAAHQVGGQTQQVVVAKCAA
jgi:hypothetical protein